jgi:hypothetical protein
MLRGAIVFSSLLSLLLIRNFNCIVPVADDAFCNSWEIRIGVSPLRGYGIGGSVPVADADRLISGQPFGLQEAVDGAAISALTIASGDEGPLIASWTASIVRSTSSCPTGVTS